MPVSNSTYLGGPGIGKTALLTTISNRLFGPGNLLRFDFRTITTYQAFRTALEKAQPLSGKVIIFDEFHALQSPRLTPHDRESILTLVGSIFKNQNTGFDFRDSWVAVISNESLADLKKKPMFQSASMGQILQQIMNTTRIELNEDLKPYMDEFVEKFESQTFTDKQFDPINPILQRRALVLDDSAKTFFKHELHKEFDDSFLPVSGRDLAISMMKPIQAIMSNMKWVWDHQKHYLLRFDHLDPQKLGPKYLILNCFNLDPKMDSSQAKQALLNWSKQASQK